MRSLPVALALLVIAASGSLAVAMAGAFLVAIGGPMGDLMLLAVMHRDLPVNQIGKVYALRMTIASIGVFAGLLLAGPLYGFDPKLPMLITGIAVPLLVVLVLLFERRVVRPAMALNAASAAGNA